ncbi:hypothetical protein HN51_019163 [Arachis hypogaea]|uniref:LOB domain-containing protein n=1 Tax=Arachis hypogaea TaxID=3818 RepID=A0A445BVT9_ARAHY|nr:LOB domain-containing protein 1 [Arachis hypogaea]XP_057731566.1 LOB domain-containing protein 1-like [Arachis stenosperma]QHO30856.1 LOB domain-containing protein [Arachis hypogaea]RYR42839.1 hypothetical protein Ahy_A08g039280 [Arachis hypogaea]
MEASDTNTPISSSQSPTSSSSLPPPPQVIMSPCAACKILRRRCAEKCVLAPYFPPTEPAKFTTAHRVFGASNIIKFLQELPESQRADAVTSMVYEAGARIRDPVYGCAGAICQLQTQVNELQAQLAKAQAEIANMQFQQANMVALLYMQMAEANNKATATTQEPPPSPQQSVDNFIASPPHINNNLNFFDDNNNTSLNSMWELFGHDHITTF